MLKFISLSIIFLSFFSQAKEFDADQNSVKTFMEELFKASKLVNTSTERKAAREKIGVSMDWDRIAKDCLGPKTWGKQPEANQTKFRNSLKEVVEKTAYTRLDKFWTADTTYSFSEIKVKGSEAEAKTKFKVKEDDFEIQYFLQKKNSAWKIYDISFEDMRYSKNIREQIEAFMKEGSFKQVLDKLAERSKELAEDPASDKATPKTAKKKEDSKPTPPPKG